MLDGIAILPLVGNIDADRAKHLLETIPLKVKEQNVRQLIIDFSGLYNFDEMVTDSLLQINSIMKLLGITCIITGIKSSFAIKIVECNIDLLGTKTFGTVQQALSSLGIK
jgi:anti-anti-sigma regulatory factor